MHTNLVIMDASDDCHKVKFKIGGAASTREWDIKVTQHSCTSNVAGPDGCLQYFTGTSGTIASFNFPTTASAITATASSHLSDQLYTMCFRQERGYCGVCFRPSIGSATATADTQNTFGLSIGVGTIGTYAADVGGLGSACVEDYLQIPGGVAAMATAGAHPTADIYERVCGRFFNTNGEDDISGVAGHADLCTYNKPFMITFRTDKDEVVTGAGNTELLNEHISAAATTPGGILGFKLDYNLQSC